MITISPSLLSCDFLNIESELNHFKNNENIWFHLDIMDGHFVPNLTFGHPVIELISKKTSIPLDAHLMVTNPDFYIDTLKNFNIHNLTFHFEATKEVNKLIHKAKENFNSVGISIKPKTSVEILSDEILRSIDLVLVMSVEPGFGGQQFIDSSYDKVQWLNTYKEKNNLNFQIQVDGGINDENAKKLIQKGASNLVAGSYIFKEGPSTYNDKINSLRKIYVKP